MSHKDGETQVSEQMGQSQTTLHREEEDLGGRGPTQQDPIKASLAPPPPELCIFWAGCGRKHRTFLAGLIT